MCLCNVAGGQGSKPGGNVNHWTICASGTHHIYRSMPGVSAEWKEAIRRLVGRGIGRPGDCGERNGSSSRRPFQASSPLCSLWCCGTYIFLVNFFHVCLIFVSSVSYIKSMFSLLSVCLDINAWHDGHGP